MRNSADIMIPEHVIYSLPKLEHQPSATATISTMDRVLLTGTEYAYSARGTAPAEPKERRCLPSIINGPFPSFSADCSGRALLPQYCVPSQPSPDVGT